MPRRTFLARPRAVSERARPETRSSRKRAARGGRPAWGASARAKKSLKRDTSGRDL